MRLAVELDDIRIGTLDGDARTFDLMPSEEAIERLGINSLALSVAIPLTLRPRRDHASRRRNWFAELLPEGDQYDFMLAQAGLRRGDTPSFLARFGRDIAGALQIWDLDDPTEPATPALTAVDATSIRRLLEDPLGAPLGNVAITGRTSLGGVQPKILLARTDAGWAQATGGAVTTHILKPRLPGERASIIYDEEYGARIARALGLSSFATWVEAFDGLPAIVIERYDRRDGIRVHQEDFDQALGASGNQKYQELGGVVSLRRVADTLQRTAPASDLRLLAMRVVLATALGDLDMHTKNISLLHPADGEVRLAPAYDTVPQVRDDTDGRMALAINGAYRHAALTREDLEAEFRAWGLRRAPALIDETLDGIATTLDEEHPLPESRPGLHEQVSGFVHNLRNGAAIGAS